MKNIVLWVLLLVCAVPYALRGQYSVRTFKLKVIDKKGRLVRGADLTYRITGQSTLEPVGNRGWSLIPGVSDSDTLYLITHNFVGALPLVGLDSVSIVGSRHNLYSKTPDGQYNIGYQTVSARNNTMSVSQLKFDDSNMALGYPDLAAYLEGRIAGVQVVRGTSGTEILIRGGSNSLMLSNAALIVVDGIIFDSFDQANSSVNIHDVLSVDVLKEGSIYGSRGANGVVIITTRNSVPPVK